MRQPATPLDAYAGRSEDAARAVDDIRKVCRLLPVHARHRHRDDGLVPVAALWRRVTDTVAAMTGQNPHLDVLVKVGLLAASERPAASGVCDSAVRLAPEHLVDLPSGRALAANPARLLRNAACRVEHLSELALDNEEQNPYCGPVYFGPNVLPAKRAWIKGLDQYCDEVPVDVRLFPLWQEHELDPRGESDVIETLLVRARREVLSTAIEATEHMVGEYLLKRSNYILLDADLLADEVAAAGSAEVCVRLGGAVIVAISKELGNDRSAAIRRLQAALVAAAELDFDLSSALEPQREALTEAVLRDFATELGRRADTLEPEGWWANGQPHRSADGGLDL